MNHYLLCGQLSAAFSAFEKQTTDQITTTIVLNLQCHPRGSQSHVIKIRLAQHHHTAPTRKLEIGRRGADIDLPNELSRRVEDVDSITTAGVDVAVRITMDSCAG